MATSVIAYDKDLPEIPGRCPWLKPKLLADLVALAVGEGADLL